MVVVPFGSMIVCGRPLESCCVTCVTCIDHLFDRGFISFEDKGKLIVSPVAHRPSLQRMGVNTADIVSVGSFTSGQKQFLDFHRNAVLLQSIRN